MSKNINDVVITMDMLKEWEPCDKYKNEDNSLNEQYILSLTNGKKEISILEVFSLPIPNLDKIWILSHDIPNGEKVKHTIEQYVNSSEELLNKCLPLPNENTLIDKDVYQDMCNHYDSFCNINYIRSFENVPELFIDVVRTIPIWFRCYTDMIMFDLAQISNQKGYVTYGGEARDVLEEALNLHIGVILKATFDYLVRKYESDSYYINYHYLNVLRNKKTSQLEVCLKECFSCAKKCNREKKGEETI